eukprot:CAMPEP_0197266488 /NCGR_PEP_ID=MMETSP1432-20130617/3032_1 /TAXON_ID=44447 /ORGANISM="Pseudo-nitzschia delicatissima, Strain UNC1205" /LENGTH=281 /DNA_ID=CAMNT_0042731361 /DNA_START=39 /DNA_END=884 /DNA_ORIENTATION=+
MTLRATLNASSGPDVLLGTNADGTPISWMEKQWPFVSWAIFLFGAGNLFARRHKRDEHWYGWLALVAYCLHQSEEHAYDLRGWRYSFVPSLNDGPISGMFEEACREFNANADAAAAAVATATTGNGVVSCPLDPKIVLWVNTIIVWIGFGGCMIFAEIWPKYLLSGSLNWGTAVVNGIGGHILPAILTKSYNPGVVQSIFMVPLGIQRILASGRPGLCLVNGVISHLALVVGIKIIFRFRTNETITMSILLLIAALAVPLGISNAVSKRSKSQSVNNVKNQ